MRHLHSQFHFRHALFALQNPDGYVDALWNWRASRDAPGSSLRADRGCGPVWSPAKFWLRRGAERFYPAIRLATMSATRSALAISVSVGLTAPIDGKKLASTT